MIYLKNKEEIEILKESGKFLSEILERLSKMARPGVSLSFLNDAALDMADELGVEMTFYGYKPEGAAKPFPAAICTSVNDVVVHGVPNDYKLKGGDILKIDAGVTYKSMITDAARTVMVGNIKGNAKKLVNSTRKALDEAIEVAQPGRTIGDVGYVISRRAKKDGFFVLKELTGHGVGYELHEEPTVFNFGRRGEGVVLRPGMVIAIEPMFSESSENIIRNPDESYSSSDRSLTAHFEDTVAITEDGNIILTR